MKYVIISFTPHEFTFYIKPRDIAQIGEGTSSSSLEYKKNSLVTAFASVYATTLQKIAAMLATENSQCVNKKSMGNNNYYCIQRFYSTMVKPLTIHGRNNESKALL